MHLHFITKHGHRCEQICKTLQPHQGKQTEELTTLLVHLLCIPVHPRILWQQVNSLCVDVATHFWRGDATQILDVIGAINQ